jgi:hypothetical protein
MPSPRAVTQGLSRCGPREPLDTVEEHIHGPPRNYLHDQTEADILRRAKLAKPIRPLPKSQAAAGIGTGAKSK